jgi:lipid II:glycine glycyltransferase (peptidoglycan interpeptide bridge formation enzyme)
MIESTVGLKEYFEKLIELEKDNNDKALKIATVELARRLEALNGEAGRLNKMQETYYPRQVAEPRFEQIEKEIKELIIFKAIAANKASKDSVTVAHVGMAVSLIVGLLSLVLRLFGI